MTQDVREIVAREWRCFHCDEVFTDRSCAVKHFGNDEDKTPACIIKGSDHGLLRALRDAEEEADKAWSALHSESSDFAKAYHSQRCRHNQALIAAEESGYEKGLRDGEALSADVARTIPAGHVVVPASVVEALRVIVDRWITNNSEGDDYEEGYDDGLKACHDLARTALASIEPGGEG